MIRATIVIGLRRDSYNSHPGDMEVTFGADFIAFTIDDRTFSVDIDDFVKLQELVQIVKQ